MLPFALTHHAQQCTCFLIAIQEMQNASQSKWQVASGITASTQRTSRESSPFARPDTCSSAVATLQSAMMFCQAIGPTRVHLALFMAGPITPGVTTADIEKAAAEVKTPPPAFVVKLSTMALMMYLQNSIGKQLKWLYPTNPDNADEWLEQEIYRAASDSRAADVFASVFYLPKPRPLNYLINELWKGPTAVVQGVLDPLNDAKVR
eukprot:GHUV01034477.1.p1 GENE.GHUV01034477.1~~GHUV01034477.1.p1  ORF type:complete len:206 (+),score=38.56 GHUV01034477.1:194-811(+)